MKDHIRLLDAADQGALAAFIERVPEGDRTFFREDVLAADVAARWQTDGGERWVACYDEAIVGYVGIVPDVGWSSHVGELRLVVDGTRRREGIGQGLARHGLLRALDTGLAKIVVQIAATQESTLQMFAGLGFEAEALLKDHVQDQAGERHDLVIMSHLTSHVRDDMYTAGIGQALASG
jgi:GNAT superfamily N-acetyltransferase